MKYSIIQKGNFATRQCMTQQGRTDTTVYITVYFPKLLPAYWYDRMWSSGADNSMLFIATVCYTEITECRDWPTRIKFSTKPCNKMITTHTAWETIPPTCFTVPLLFLPTHFNFFAVLLHSEKLRSNLVIQYYFWSLC